MKKSLISLIAVLVAQQSFACLGEAQIVARVESSALVGSTSCTVQIDLNSIELYQQNPACPLDLHAISQNGIEVGVRREDTCLLENGETLRGQLVQDSNGTIYLNH